MRIPVSWLRDFVDVPGTAQEIAATMSVRGFALEGVEMLADGDAVLDFEVTANRPDCMSVLGIAREVATAYGLPLRPPGVHEHPGDRSGEPAGPPAEGASGPHVPVASLALGDTADIEITIDNPDLCPRYAGAVAAVAVGPSPAWLQARLRAGGVRPISNVVDVTNYVLLELGQPMHAFDRARLGGGRIHVRTAAPGETIRTIDGIERTLTPDMLVIADAHEPIAVAGVKGGARSEVTGATRTIVFESAYFNPLSVRRTSKALGLKTDASMRFERGMDPQLPVAAMNRACALLEMIGAGRARGPVVDRYPTRLHPTVLKLRREKVTGLLGTVVSDAEIRRILESLGFVLGRGVEEDGWEVTVPTRRVDVLREVDLIEEVARHYGLDRIPVRLPSLAAAPRPMDARITRARALRHLMTGAGFFEAVTFGFTSEPAAREFGDDDVVPIANPLSENFAVLRPSALPGLIDVVAHNRRREQRDVRIFEVGARFSRSAGERRALACAWIGVVGDDHWSGGTRPVDFFDIKGLAERVCAALGVDVRAEVSGAPWLVRGQGALLVARGTPVGACGRLAPAVAERHGLPSGDAVYVAEVDLDAIDLVAPARATHVAALPRYPSVTRDISIVVTDTLSAERLRDTITETAPTTLVRVREFDRYQGKGIPEGTVSVSLRLTFRSPDRTLTDAEVQDAMGDVIRVLADVHHAVQR